MRIFTVYIINMKRSRQCILPEIIKPQKGRKSSASHTSHQCAFLRIKTIRPYTLMSEQMQCLILICIIGFLKNSYIIYAAFMKILILIYVYRINFNSDVFEIFPSNFYCLTNIFHIRIFPAFSCKQQYLFHSSFGYDLHFMLYFLEI